MHVQGTSHCWLSSKQLGHYDPELLQVSAFRRLLLDKRRANGVVPILGGDFSASIGILFGGPGDEDDDVDLLGGALVAEMKKTHGLCNGYFQMGCASPADRNMLTLHTAGLANGRFTEIAIKLISYFQMPGFLWNQFGMISWYPLALITDVFIA